MMKDGMRRIAVHELITHESSIELCVVEIVDGKVVDYYKLDSELPFTEWLGGTVVLSYDDDGVRAFYNGKLIE